MATTDIPEEKSITVSSAVLLAIMVFLAGFIAGVFICDKMEHEWMDMESGSIIEQSRGTQPRSFLSELLLLKK